MHKHASSFFQSFKTPDEDVKCKCQNINPYFRHHWLDYNVSQFGILCCVVLFFFFCIPFLLCLCSLDFLLFCSPACLCLPNWFHLCIVHHLPLVHLTLRLLIDSSLCVGQASQPSLCVLYGLPVAFIPRFLYDFFILFGFVFCMFGLPTCIGLVTDLWFYLNKYHKLILLCLCVLFLGLIPFLLMSTHGKMW